MPKQITTAIPYMTGSVHIGNTMDHILADILTSYHRLRGEHVQFLAGSDEHGIKVYNKAKKIGKTPIEMLDENVALYKNALEQMNIHPDDFIRTTDKTRHWPVAQEMWKRMEKNGDIYKKSYTGNYCEGCELFLTDKDIDEEGNCIHHQTPPKQVEEENYFFKLSKFSESLTRQIQNDEIHVHPVFRKNEMLAFIESGLEDVSFSRRADTMPWGIPVPGDEEHVMYVWCDALVNYLTGAGFLQDEAKFEQYNPAYVHIIGKDISRFHCLFYMAMLESAGLPRSENILVHGFVTSGGNRLSKTLGNILDPIEMTQKYGSDAVKFFIATASGVGKDIDYTEEWFHALYTDILANNYGNFVNRVITLCAKYEVWGKRYEVWDLQDDFSFGYNKYTQAMECFDIKEASEVPITFLDTANKFLNESEPWKMTNEKQRAEVLLAALEYMYHITVLLRPLLPLATEKVFAGLGMSEINWDPNFRYTQTDFTLTKPDILFERVEYAPAQKQEKILNVAIHPELEQQVIYTRIQIPNNSKKQSKPLQTYIANRLQELDIQKLRKNPILTAYYEHFDTIGLAGQEPAGANLLNLLEKNNKLPNINRLVDIYNVTSLATGLSFWVHDADSLPDDVSITLASWGEPFDAMLGAELPPIQPDETILLGSDGRAYGRDIKQSEQSKVSENTRDVLIYIQGNTATTKKQLETALTEVQNNIETFIQK